MGDVEVPEAEPLTEDLHPQDEEGEGEEQVQSAPNKQEVEETGEWDPESSQYHWDEDEDETDNHTVTYRSSTI